MTAGELLRAHREGTLEQFLRSFCGTAVMYRTAPMDVTRHAGNISAYVTRKSVSMDNRRSEWTANNMTSAWTRGSGAVVLREGTRSVNHFRSNNTVQVSSVLMRHGGASALSEGEGEVPSSMGPEGDWVAFFGGVDAYDMRADDGWRRDAPGVMRALTFSGTRWGMRVPVELPWYHRMWQWNELSRDAYVRVGPGVMVVNQTPDEMAMMLSHWGRAAAVRVARILNEARFLATRYTREGVGSVTRIRNGDALCYRCGMTRMTCTCRHGRKARVYVEGAVRSSVTMYTARLNEAQRELRVADERMKIVERAVRECGALFENGTITGYRVSEKFMNVFMGPFKLELPAERWEKNGDVYEWVAGTYEMPAVWVRIPWLEPGSVKVLDMEGKAHPHGHVLAGTDGLPCLGDRSGVQRELETLWFEKPGEFVMHWWNYMQQYNPIDRGYTGPIHTCCVLVKAKEVESGATD